MKYLSFILLILSGLTMSAQTIDSTRLQPGDLLFQNLDCGAMCDAIEAVTQGVDGQDFSHVAILCRQESKWMVIEAMGAGVRMIALDSFSKRTKNAIYVGRVKKQYRKMIPAALAFAEMQIGIPYDNAFIYDNGKYYCSELVYDAFKAANRNRPFFRLEPMTYKEPGSDEFFPVWQEYYKKLKIDIPEGLPGCNPGGLSRSKKIDIIGTMK